MFGVPSHGAQKASCSVGEPSFPAPCARGSGGGVSSGPLQKGEHQTASRAKSTLQDVPGAREGRLREPPAKPSDALCLGRSNLKSAVSRVQPFLDCGLSLVRFPVLLLHWMSILDYLG